MTLQSVKTKQNTTNYLVLGTGERGYSLPILNLLKVFSDHTKSSHLDKFTGAPNQNFAATRNAIIAHAQTKGCASVLNVATITRKHGITGYPTRDQVVKFVSSEPAIEKHGADHVECWERAIQAESTRPLAEGSNRASLEEDSY